MVDVQHVMGLLAFPVDTKISAYAVSTLNKITFPVDTKVSAYALSTLNQNTVIVDTKTSAYPVGTLNQITLPVDTKISAMAILISDVMYSKVIFCGFVILPLDFYIKTIHTFIVILFGYLHFKYYTVNRLKSWPCFRIL